MTPWASAPDLTPEKRKTHKKHNLFACFRPNICKDHWEPDSAHPICYGCLRKFTIFFRRHHCRRCGKVFCFACSGLKMRLDENAQIEQGGYFHRVCFFCYGSKDSCIFNEQCVGQITSLSNAFRKMRNKDSLRSSFSLAMDISRQRFGAEVAELCRPVLDNFMMSRSKGGLVKPVKAVGNAILKAGRDSICNKCNDSILVPKNRKLCMQCTRIYCKKCSSKRLVLFSDGTRDGQPEILLSDTFDDLVQKYTHCEVYRTCLECEYKVKTLLDRANFDKTLDSLYREMSHIQFDIKEALRQQDKGIRHTRRSLSIDETVKRDSGIEMGRFSEIVLDGDIDESFDLLSEREIMIIEGFCRIVMTLVALLNVLLGNCWIIKPATKCHDCNPKECAKIKNTKVCHEKRISTYCPLSCGLCSDTKPLHAFIGCYVSKSECDTINPYYCYSSVVRVTCPDLCNSQRTTLPITARPQTKVTHHLKTSPEVVTPEVTQSALSLETSPEVNIKTEVATIQEELHTTSEQEIVTSEAPQELTDALATNQIVDQFMTSLEPSAMGSTDSPVKRMCHVCEDPFCNLHFETIVKCPAWQPFCMNYIAINVQGTKTLHKRCASEVECDFKWINRTAGISECLLFDNNKIYTKPIHCEFCCTTDNCNIHTVPKYNTLKHTPA
ncbi:hypothetical protein LOTGIDRAFT_229970 [Lottia gigantea]|uniref:FYVE-type domain-containing protein n=1 Tax=Lottia gigantea TaxID=225164 RepID=V4CQZ1_LOTGI|nr:hypothetical protein LOTGIDRAFT_229970 [Lottia gigantea]ESP04885.1 hypothetical protein LOTGIDRAFT_229970 [Lottia gigantea]